MTVYTIPATTPFIDALAVGLLAMAGPDVATLADMTVLLPNRRACRSLRDAFLRLRDGQALLLPTIRPLGDVEEDALFLGNTVGDAPDIPPSIPPLRRQIVLARMVLAARPDIGGFATAMDLAASLARLIDQVHTEGLDFERLDHIVLADFAQHWQVTLSFLDTVLRRHWPAFLASEGAVDPGLHRRLKMEAYATELLNAPPSAPLIAAGSTGSIPATAQVLRLISQLPNGHVVLPGLDQVLSDAAWDAVTEGHPQATLKNLLACLGQTRADIPTWPYAPAADRYTPPVQAQRRDYAVSALMLPATQLEAWRAPNFTPAAFDGMAVLEADSLDHEAASIAVMLREFVEQTPDTRQAFVVTPDRILAGRISTILRRWGIACDDSAGVPLTRAPAAQFLLSLCGVLAQDTMPHYLLATLKSPLCGPFGYDAATWSQLVLDLDAYAVRGPCPTGGIAAWGHADHPELQKFLGQLDDVLTPVMAGPASLSVLLEVAEKLAAPATLWAGESGQILATLLSQMLEEAAYLPALSWADCQRFLKRVCDGVPWRQQHNTHPRIAILGPIEARLQHGALMILGSLNENFWPEAPGIDPWMSRPMRANFGLPAPERSITLASHDVAQALCAPRVVITRAKQRDGAPTTPSRWLQRLDTLYKALGVDPDILRGHTRLYRDLAAKLDQHTGAVLPPPKPAPVVPEAYRPTKFSVTDIATWLMDPYSIYAKKILKLSPLEDIDTPYDARERGTVIHAILEDFNKTYPKALPDDAVGALKAIAHKHFSALDTHPDIVGHWAPRFYTLIPGLIAKEHTWRAGLEHIYSEVSGAWTLPSKMGPITLKGRADRFEKTATGYRIIDYKSGRVPSLKSVRNGQEPQLTILAYMLRSGCFDDVLGPNPKKLDALAYWSVSALKQGAMATATLDNDLEDISDQAAAQWRALVAKYLEEGAVFEACPDPADAKALARRDYAHLSRLPAWASEADMEDDTTSDDADILENGAA